jgi:signal transduction histidine kinase
MSSALRQPTIGAWLLIVLAVAFGPSAELWAAPTPKQVLVLYSTRRDAPMSIVGDRELPRILEEGLKEVIDYYSEYIDLGRFPEPGYQAAFGDFLQVKYQGHRFDLVVAIQAAAVEFVSKHQTTLFPDTPVVFLVTSRPAHGITNSTGVIAELDLADTVSLAARLQPDIRNIFVVSGAAIPDKGYEAQARAQLRSFENRLTVTYLSGLATNDLEARLATLPERSIVYYLNVYEDGDGVVFSPLRYGEQVASVARAPTYSWSDAVMNHGVVGGSLLDRQAMMDAVAKLSLRVLHGEHAGGIPVSSPGLQVNQVDWRQLRRWGISEARVPAGTRILFRDPSLWDRYKAYILGTVALVLAQSTLIAGLLLQARRRRQAEEQLRGREAELRTSYERIRDLGGRLLNAQEAERSRIARELHDDVSQQAALLAFDLSALSGVDKVSPEETSRRAREASDRAQGIAKTLHDLSHKLHPAKLRLLGLVSSLASLQRDFSKQGLKVVFSHDNVPAALPHDLSLCVFRIVQEALGNAAKHSRASEVSVNLSASPDKLLLVIVDDGVGFDVDAAWGHGLGLISMYERLEPIGGTLKIRSKPGTGTRLEICVPYRSASMTETVA